MRRRARDSACTARRNAPRCRAPALEATDAARMAASVRTRDGRTTEKIMSRYEADGEETFRVRRRCCRGVVRRVREMRGGVAARMHFAANRWREGTDARTASPPHP